MGLEITLALSAGLNIVLLALYLKEKQKVANLDTEIGEMEEDESAMEAENAAKDATLKENATLIAELRAQIANGQPVTPEQLARLEAVHQKFQAFLHPAPPEGGTVP